tara:strand:- start:922 stop:1191 length:270 start_codon:yes stop_codon:yes gene_type:complete
MKIVRDNFANCWQIETSMNTTTATLAVKLLSSDNEFLSYPCKGRLQITEYFGCGKISAVFQQGRYDGSVFRHYGKTSVVVENPVFTYGK